MNVRSFMSVARAVAWRQLHNFVTSPPLLLPSIVFPLFFLLAFGGGLSSVGDVPGFNFPSGYTAFQFVWSLLQTAAFGGVFTGFSIAMDYESGFARRLMLAVPNRVGIVAGYAIAGVVRALITGTVLFSVALLSGMNVDGNGIHLAGLITLALVLNVAATLFGTGVALRIRSMQAGPLMQMPVFLTLFLVPVWVPLELLTGWIRSVASVNPVTAILGAGRAFISGQPSGSGMAFAVVAGLVAVFGVWALTGLRRAERAG